MTPEQFESWKDFTKRLVEHAHEELDSEDRAEAMALCNDFFDNVEDWELADVIDWDHGKGELVTDAVKDLLWDSGHKYTDDDTGEMEITDVGIAVMASIRAGIDVGVSPSAGVLLYDLADIRRMYPEGIPSWVAEFLPENHDAEPGSLPLWL